VLAIDLGADQIPAMALGTERAEAGTMARPPRPRSERLLNRATFIRIAAGIGPLVALAAMASFLFAYALAGWRPWEGLADSGDLYLEATTMTMAGIVFAQVGAAMAWRTNRESIRTVGLLSNRLLLVGIAVEIGMVALLAYTPGLDGIFHTTDLSGWEWLFLVAWPPLVLGAEELRKAVVRRRSPEPGDAQ
jgi:magnesium-transporting ATPase (P-type)